MRRLFVGFSSQDSRGSNKLYDIQLVNRDLLNHFHTRKGERRMMPTYGTRIWELLFEPFTPALKDELIQDATAVIDADTRVQLLSIEVKELAHGIKIEMQLKYDPLDVIQRFAVDFDKRSANRS